MFIECRKPLVSTPDVFDVYATGQYTMSWLATTIPFSIEPQTEATTEATTEPVEPTEAPTEPPAEPTDAPTEPPAEPTEAPIETTTEPSYYPTESTEAPTPTDLSSVYNDCQFFKGVSSAFFDSGWPYRNDMRHGL